ncbi:interleukin-22 [Thomomys bottae]
MAALQNSPSSSLLGTLAAGCLLLLALWMPWGASAPITSNCRLDKSEFQRPYFINLTFSLAEEASFADNNTDVRLIGDKLLRGVHAKHHCYLMKQVLNFTLEEVLIPYYDKFQPYMKEVVPFLEDFSHKLDQCHIGNDDQQVQKRIQNLKDTVKMLGESGEIKVIGELYPLFIHLRKACI